MAYLLNFSTHILHSGPSAAVWPVIAIRIAGGAINSEASRQNAALLLHRDGRDQDEIEKLATALAGFM